MAIYEAVAVKVDIYPCMDLSEFFNTRMRNECAAVDCKECTEWRTSIKEVFQDTIDAGWQLTEKVPKPKPQYVQQQGVTISGGNGWGTGSGTGGDITINSRMGTGSLVFSAPVEEEEQQASMEFDTRSMHINLGTMRIEFLGTRWFCKSCANDLKMCSLLQ